MEEAALQDYRDKDVHSSRDFTAKVGSPSFIHANQHLFQFETLSYSLQLYNGEKLPDTEGVVVKQGPQQNPFADSEFFLFVRKNCLLQNYLIDLQNLNKLCGR